ncbi:tail fiber domain-containing protein [Salinibacter grassmerensis]|uniref:tail fiber domain-containing protein n=1 Tax=Salinibacter grassmerensis TaxID=3040353 RepID=UPI0021E7365B|nr:tail fiber domain-containing protein [Salinibacter grassmerensis]
MQASLHTSRLFSIHLVAAALGGLGLLALGLGTVPVHGQTPTTTIENGNTDTRLQLNYDGGLYVPGSYVTDGTENDSIPAEGAGTRMMWYPAKAAVRAGRVGGTEWDAVNVGKQSAALGFDTKASGLGATAMGGGTTASGDYATATGFGTTASGSNATSMGFNTTASNSDATAMGNGTTASGLRTTAMGNGTTASGSYATAMGSNTTAATDQSLSIGRHNSANTSADGTFFVVGNGSLSTPSDALVLTKTGDLTISGSLTESSDRRLKTGIEPLSGGILQKLGALRPVRYRFKDPATHPSGEQVGLIAQGVQKQFPALVSEGSGGTLSLSYSKMTAVLLKGVQEQQAQVRALQSENDRFRAQNVEIESRVEQIEDMKTRLAALESKKSSVLPAGWGPTALLMLVVGAGSFAGGLIWRRRT